MRLTYWIAVCLDDSEVYNIRAKTKKDVLRILKDSGNPDGVGFGKPRKVTVEYEDNFDLMEQCMSEGRGYWESLSESECKYQSLDD
jgi:hypothetical protein